MLQKICKFFLKKTNPQNITGFGRGISSVFFFFKKRKVYDLKNKGNHLMHVHKLKDPSPKHTASCSQATFNSNLWTWKVERVSALPGKGDCVHLCIRTHIYKCAYACPCFSAVLLRKAVHTSPCCYMCLSADYKMC